MSHNQLDTLIRMINQIAANNCAYTPEDASQRVANHIKQFWARKMKKLLLTHYVSGGEGLSPIAQLAMEKLVEYVDNTDEASVISG